MPAVSGEAKGFHDESGDGLLRKAINHHRTRALVRTRVIGDMKSGETRCTFKRFFGECRY
jgi:hypothetical protein